MRFSYPKNSLEDLRVDMSRAMRSCVLSIGLPTSLGRVSGPSRESAALGFCPSLCDGLDLRTTPVREFLRDLMSVTTLNSRQNTDFVYLNKE